MNSILGPIVESSAARTKSLVLAANAYLGRYREVIWLIGDGRSGTTWVSSLINHQRHYREMFEPFHPRVLDPRVAFRPNTYIRPDDPCEAFRAVATDVFNGRLTQRRVDRDSRAGLYSGLLIKDIFANLFAYWARHQFPRVKIVLLLRNPFEVALSKLRKRQWLWTTDPLDLLEQPALYEDVLHPFEKLIRTVSARNDYIQNQILIWSILNCVPLAQFSAADLHVVFYEHLRLSPNDEVTAIMRFVRPRDAEQRVTIPQGVVDKPSRVTAVDSPLRTGATPADSWKNELTPAQIDAGLEILNCFGLDALYPMDSMPRRDRLAGLRQPRASGARC